MKSSSNKLDWQVHIHAGRSYLNTAANGFKRSSVFNNELIYQLIAMAVEKLLVGVYQYHHQMPADHTLEGLVDGLVNLCPVDRDLADSIKAMGRFDDMCPLVPVNRSVPGDLEIAAMLAVGRRVVEFTGTHTTEPGTSYPKALDPTVPASGSKPPERSSILN